MFEGIDQAMQAFEPLTVGLFIFALAIFLGYELITKVPPTLHTPLMSGSNAISGITMIGALLLAGQMDNPWLAKIMATLHTPLMSGSNAISGITIVGALYCAKQDFSLLANILGAVAITFAMINVIGGFAVTRRMLAMFGGKKKS